DGVGPYPRAGAGWRPFVTLCAESPDGTARCGARNGIFPAREGRESRMYEQSNAEQRPARPISRRRFVQGLVAGGVLAGLDLWRRPAPARGAARAQEVLTGSEFALTIEHIPVNFTGYSATATAINGSIPGPVLRWREGDTVTIAVTNRLAEDTSIHWHGVRTPANMDGVPGLSFPGIAPK